MKHDPLQKPEQPPPLFRDTRAAAGAAAARSMGKRHAQILDLLHRHGPLAIFECAAYLGLFDHQISGRFSQLEAERRIVRTGTRKVKPDTGCEAELYAVAPELPPLDLGASLGYPDTIRISGDEGGLFERQPTPAEEKWPGIAYRLKGSGLVYRVHLIPCPGCGAPLKQVMEGTKKTYSCGTEECKARRLEGAIITEPGRPLLLALVMRTL